jgi:hypothetical protein
MGVRVIRVLEYFYEDLIVAEADMANWRTSSDPGWRHGKELMRTVGITFSHSDDPWLPGPISPLHRPFAVSHGGER